MVPTANNNTPTPEPTGDLEQLFRQKLGEAEVAPRVHLWEQIDHELLVQQNEAYRRRLVWHRWVAAACILLFLGAGSWFTVRQSGLGEPLPGVAVTLPGSARANAGAGSGATRAAAAGNAESLSRRSGLSAAQLAMAAQAPVEAAPGSGPEAGPEPDATLATLLNASSEGEQPGDFFSNGRLQTTAHHPSIVAFGGGSAAPGGSFYDRVIGAARSSYSGTHASATNWLTALSSQAVTLPGASGTGLNAARPDTLKPSLVTLPAMSLAQAPVASPSAEEKRAVAVAHPKRWRLMGAYGASAYNPNMSFASAPATASFSNGIAGPAVSRNNANAYELAAEEYRQNLRPGFAQRVALTVSYVATKHWTLSAGVGAAEQRATSQTSHYFLDGKMPTPPAATASIGQKPNVLAPPPAAQLRTAQYRYRTAGIPVSVRYGSARNGWSLYAKVGAAVNVLLNTHSELAGVPEATTSYSLTSPNSPYRKVQSSVNGGAGLRYKPAAAEWSVAVGPTAEAGLSTLNTDAVQVSSQTRPYALGLEASVEFGGKTAVVAH
jgi:hypothetical protein